MQTRGFGYTCESWRMQARRPQHTRIAKTAESHARHVNMSMLVALSGPYSLLRYAARLQPSIGIVIN